MNGHDLRAALIAYKHGETGAAITPEQMAEAAALSAVILGEDGPPCTEALRRDAMRWRAISRVGRVRVLGSAGLGDLNNGSGYAHIGLELWTRYRDADGEYLAKERARAIPWLTQYADVAVTQLTPELAHNLDTDV